MLKHHTTPLVDTSTRPPAPVSPSEPAAIQFVFDQAFPVDGFPPLKACVDPDWRTAIVQFGWRHTLGASVEASKV